MFNLIDQSDILKGLDDQRLQQEMQQPSGAVPPFLILSEISRRKDMRQRFAGELAQQAPKTTVMQDVLAAPPMPGMGPQPGVAPPAGLAAAAQMGGGMPSMGMGAGGGPGFAGGGLVAAGSVPPTDPNDYNALIQRYETDLSNTDAQRKQDAALALLAAGAGIMGGGHSNLGQNLGVGINAGLNAYQTGLNSTDARETNALRGLQDLTSTHNQQALQQLNYNLALRQQQQAEDPTSVQNTPQSIREAQAINAMPDGPAKDTAISIATPYAAQNVQNKKDMANGIADQMVNGTIAPDMSKMYGMGPYILSALGTNHPDFNYKYANLAYQADVKAVGALNTGPQLRIRQGVEQLDETLTNVQQLADQWNGSGFPPFNHAALVAEANNPNDPKKQALATALLAQVDHVTAELGQVYMGGNTPTDAAFKLAKSQLSADWSKATFDEMIKQTKTNLAIRRASLNQVPIVPGSYAPSAPGGGAPATDQTALPDVPWSITP